MTLNNVHLPVTHPSPLLPGIHEYNEEMEVTITRLSPDDASSVMAADTYMAHIDKRLVIKAFNEAGHNSTEVDLVDLLEHVKATMPDLWGSI